MRAYIPADGPQPRSPITSVISTSTIDLLRKLLSLEDYINAAEQLNNSLDVKDMLELLLLVIRNRYLYENPDIKRRARRLMSKIKSRSPVLPRSLFLMGLAMPGDRDRIGEGASGLVFKGEHEGKAVALKMLYKTHKSVVRYPINLFPFHLSFRYIRIRISFVKR